jgi:PAS domain S-box-containing protein
MTDLLTASQTQAQDLIQSDWLDAVQEPLMVYRDEQIVYVNQALVRLTAVPAEEWRGRPHWHLAHPDFQEKVRVSGWLRDSSADPTQGIELRLSCSESRHECWAEAIEKKIAGSDSVVVTLHDLSSRLRADRREAHLRWIMHEVVESASLPTFVIGMDHRIIFWNRACAVLTGTTASDVVGTDRHGTAFHHQERPLLADLVVDELPEQGYMDTYGDSVCRSELNPSVYQSESFYPNLGASGLWLYCTAAPIRDANGQLIGAIETVQDENALREHQARLQDEVQQRTLELAQANQHLVQSEKMASIGQLAAGVAHEINNPIGYVFSNLGSLKNYIDDLFQVLEAYEKSEEAITSDEQRQALQRLRETMDLDFLREDIPTLMHESQEGITRVKKIVQDLKDFSRVDHRQEWQWADLHACIDSTLNVVNNEIKYKADVVKEYGQLPQVECLPSELNQVFLNLLVNAAQAMKDGRGVITIRTGSGGDTVWLEFGDNGSGIPEAIQTKIFDPFFTTKPVGEGTGLGLSLSYGIVQKHQGHIMFTSRPSEGTVFRIELPVKRADPVELFQS